MSTEQIQPLACIACGKQPEAVFEQSRQPYGATNFQSNGHYGSTVFDPMSGGVSITINVCDDCLRARCDRVLMVTEDVRTTHKYAAFEVCDE